MRDKVSSFSESMEDYLEIIFILGSDNVRSVDIATKMHVSKASVNRAVNMMIEKGLVTKAPYGEICLTESGRITSQKVLTKHLVIRKFLIDILGVDAAIADDEACGIEHNISDDTLAKFEKLVNKQK